MEKIGIIKEIDKAGRICVPKEMRERYNLKGEIELVATTEGLLVRSQKYVLVKKEER